MIARALTSTSTAAMATDARNWTSQPPPSHSWPIDSTQQGAGDAEQGGGGQAEVVLAARNEQPRQPTDDQSHRAVPQQQPEDVQGEAQHPDAEGEEQDDQNQGDQCGRHVRTVDHRGLYVSGVTRQDTTLRFGASIDPDLARDLTLFDDLLARVLRNRRASRP